MKRIFILFVLFVTHFSLQSQTTNTLTAKIDSLQKVIKITSYDTARYTSWNWMGNHYRSFNVDSAFYCHNKAMELAIKLKSEIKRARALFGTARDHAANKAMENAFKIFDEALAICDREISAQAKNPKELKNAKQLKGEILLQIGFNYKNTGDPVKSEHYLTECININLTIKDTVGLIKGYSVRGKLYHDLKKSEQAEKDMKEGIRICELSGKNRLDLSVLKGNLGLTYGAMGENKKAMDEYYAAYKIDSVDANTAGMVRHLCNISAIYRNEGNYSKALSMLFNALKAGEGIKDLKIQAFVLSSVGTIYSMQGQYDKAIDFMLRAIAMNIEINNTRGISDNYNNIGIAYMEQGSQLIKKNRTLAEQKFEKALAYYNKADSMHLKGGNIAARSAIFANRSIIYKMRGDMRKAIEMLEEALKIDTEINYKVGITIISGDLGEYYTIEKQYAKAEKYLLLSLNIARETGYTKEEMVAHRGLYPVYEALHKPDLALKHYKLYITFRDSLQSVENTRASVEQELKFNFDKKTTADSIRVAADKQIVNAQLKQEKVQRYSLYGGLLLVALFAVFMVKRFRITNKQKKIIEEQKEIVEEKHKEITDSINYAERIQRSFLATEELLNANLKDYFVFFQPKDVVSGDFYWAAAGLGANKNFTLVTADSTGHGVPGAIMSLLNVTSLEKAIEHFHHPADILNDTRKTIIERLKKDGSAEGGKDGMDCSLISFDFINNRLTYAAANNPVWIVRNNSIVELAPDKMPVGKHDKDTMSFTQHEIELQTGDMIYTLTDGLADQFGGPKGKKFMYKQLKQLLISISVLNAKEQKNALETAFDKWKGDMEQVDDVCLIGIKI